MEFEIKLEGITDIKIKLEKKVSKKKNKKNKKTKKKVLDKFSGPSFAEDCNDLADNIEKGGMDALKNNTS